MSIARDRILYEDEHLLAVNKLSGELVVKGSGRTDKLPLLDFLMKEYPGLRALHRLDFETSGIVLFAKTKESYNKILEEHFAGWKKIYRALLLEKLEQKQGEITKPLSSRTSGKPVPASTRYTMLHLYAHATYVEAEIESGRHHQIRKHFASIGHPLLLDELYGDERFNRMFAKEFRLHRFFLHAVRIEFPHPITEKKVVITAQMPKPFIEALKRLR